MDLQLLLSSSMDKTVRLWDMETKTCLKLFAHNDYGKMSSHVINTILTLCWYSFILCLTMPILLSNIVVKQIVYKFLGSFDVGISVLQ